MPWEKRFSSKIESFDFETGRVLAGKYVVEGKIGSGWEGEVFKITERTTGVVRAAKFFFPHRNEKNKAVTFYARKLERLRKCPILIRYHHSETIRYRRHLVTCLVSEYVEGELLEDFVKRQPGRRLRIFEGLHLLHTLASGLEIIHAAREYHGDLHDCNVLVRREGIRFVVKVVDFYNWGRPSAAHVHDDVADIIRLFYDAVGGPRRYASQPEEVKAICRGLRRDLIRKHFPTARRLREHLESFSWD
ncbi:MAG: protein kinase domain-containing protein [Planctomycetota bacterium]|jgi:tRNA A-37 threonylcarbamoyl transferase component Bud32